MTTELIKTDQAITNLYYAKDLMFSGKFYKAAELIDKAIALIGKSNAKAIDSELVKLIGG